MDVKNPLVSVKWTYEPLGARGAYRNKVTIDELFPPGPAGLDDFEEKIFTRLWSDSLDARSDRLFCRPHGPVIISVRLPGTKVYEPLSFYHKAAAQEAGRIRLKIVFGPPHAMSPSNSTATVRRKPARGLYDPSPYMESFLSASGSTAPRSTNGSGGVPVPDRPVQGTFKTLPVQALLADASSAIQGKVSAGIQIPKSINEAGRTPAVSKESLAASPFTAIESSAVQGLKTYWKDLSKGMSQSFVTRGQVAAMIDERILERIADLAPSKCKDESCADPQGSCVRGVSIGSGYLHLALCDSCDLDIYGTRYKCLDCPDFDSCETCWNNVRKAHSTHRFVAIKDDSLIPALCKEKVQTHTDVHCDGPLCVKKNSNILGDRYMCSVCKNFDLCASCEADPGNHHDRSHHMIKMKSPDVTLRAKIERSDSPVAACTPSEDAKSSRLPNCMDEKTIDSGHAYAAETSPAPAGKLIQKCARLKRKQNAERSVCHLNVACDGCDDNIWGPRYMCAGCPNFDLCQDCYRNNDHEPSHVFVRYNHFVNHSLWSRPTLAAVEPLKDGVHCGFYCNECQEMPIKNKRYTCLKCVNYDTCEKCSDMHKRHHAMKIVPSRFVAVDATSPAVSATVDETRQASKATVEAEGLSDEQHSLLACFVEDVSIPDGTVVRPEATFVKQWLLRNDGSVAWPAGVMAVFTGGLDLTVKMNSVQAQQGTALQTTVQPGQNVVVSIFLQAPASVQDNVVSYFTLMAPSGQRFGCKLWADIDVRSSADGMCESIPLVAAEEAAPSVEQSARPVEVSHDESAKPVEVLHDESAKLSEVLLDTTPTAVEELDTAEKEHSTSNLGSDRASLESDLIFPSASMEIVSEVASGSGSHSNAETQHDEEAWDSGSELIVSDEDDYEFLEDETPSVLDMN